MTHVGSNPTSSATYKFFQNFTLLERKFSLEKCTFRLMYYVYVLQSKRDESLYIGYTVDLRKRLEDHNSGKSKATKPFRPYKLVFYESFLNRFDAKNREIYLKSGWGFRSIKKLLK